MNGNLVETLIGGLVLVVAAGFLYFAFNRADVAGVDGYTLIAKFDKVDGINVGSDVLLGGIKIGTVVDQKLDLKNISCGAVRELARRCEAADRFVDQNSFQRLARGKLSGN